MPFSIRPYHRLPVPFRKLPLAYFVGFWSLITLLMLSSGPAYAEWVKIASSEKPDGRTGYVDPGTIRRKGNLVKMWALDDYKTVRTTAGKSYLSMRALDEYDCAEEQFRTLAVYSYAGQMGAGDMVESDENPGKWKPVIPGSVGQTAWNSACAK